MSKDIDFEELDRAVNSLMGSVAATTPGRDEDARPNTLSISTTLRPDEKPAYQKIEEVAKTIGSETLDVDAEKRVVLDESPANVTSVAPATSVAPTPLPAQPVVAAPVQKPLSAVPRPSTGRFMDVVHPSLAMRPTANDLPPLVVPERGAVSQPLTEQTASPLPEPMSEPEQATAPVVAAPIEEPAITPALEEAPTPAIAEVKITPPEPVLEEPVPSIPLTPFLPDAKVEKRPLGEPMAPLGPVPSPFTDKDEQPVDEPLPAPSDWDAPAAAAEPADADLALDEPQVPMAEEIAMPDADAQQPEEENESADVGQTQEDTKPPVLPEPALADPSEMVNIRPEADISVRTVESGDTERLTAIRQAATQDLESDDIASGDAVSGGIYDVDSQPKPIIYPAKQKSGMLTVVIILVIILVAAGLGVGAYFALGLSA